LIHCCAWYDIRMIRSALLILISVAAGGCGTPPMRVIDYRCGHSTTVVKAPLRQTYTLYAEPHQRIESTTLSQEEPVGFARSGATLLAVVGADRIPLPDGNYVWLVEFGPEPPEDTGLRAAGTAAAIAAYAAFEIGKGYIASGRGP
jgi:hypothetical protein